MVRHFQINTFLFVNIQHGLSKVSVKLNFNIIYFQFDPLLIKLNYKDGRCINVYFYISRQTYLLAEALFMLMVILLSHQVSS